MKAVRIIGNILIGIILFVLIFSLSFVQTTKSFLEKDLVVGLVKTSIVETLNKEAGKIEEGKDAILEEIFSDKETNTIINIVIENFKKYQDDKKHFSVSDSDVEKITSFALKYKSQISKIAGDKVEEITDEKLKEILSKENINELSNRIYEELSSSVGEEVDEVFDVYDNVTSDSTMYMTIGAIVFLIIILGLLNWSLFKWMIVPGVCLITSGIFMCLMYAALYFLKDAINSSKVLDGALGSIKFNTFFIVGALEIIVGIILVVVYTTLKNKPLNEQINNLGVGE